ncbi:hypothetical protein [Streptomyces sp. NPDC052225]|uniref:hypothetical protein n=1 Tax=Streptomyces sp. NPDC052225 TaxID=3154949 RepID=UPI0034167AA5
MTAYTQAFQALTGKRALTPAEATRLLAAVLDEHAGELADVIRTEAKRLNAPQEKDTPAIDRRKRRRHRGMQTAASLIDPAHKRAQLPHQRDRSTS